MKSIRHVCLLICCLFAVPVLAFFQEKPADEAKSKESAAPPEPMSSATFSGLKLRSIGPALTSGRIADFAVDPNNRNRYFVAVASGGVWKTVNSGTTWTPVFDSEGSYSIGVVVLDPKNPSVVWVGTGENNSQRSVGYGDGVYRSDDGGRTWKNVGLKKSEHIGRIVIDPRNTDVVYVAAQGPLWAPGGDRGVYKTIDSGKTWKNILPISENTGVTDLVMDPRDSNVLYAASYQRRRHVWTLIDGGPESAIYKSTDAGATWTKLSTGLPTEEMGRIGLAISPANPDVVYATIEAANKAGGIFRSKDRGATWERRNEFDVGAMYYARIFADPKNVDRIYVMNVLIRVSDDGGKTLHPQPDTHKHVDNHAMWIDPADTDYYLVGCDGGIYESFDRGATWNFKANLPVTQFYDVAVDNARPFYNIYAGTQDNYSLGGPSRTRSASGIINSDWFVTQGGDGFRSVVDPDDPNTVYAESQYGGLVRFDRKSGESIGIQPQPGKGAEPFRWNWDSPLIISPHSRTRLYFAANLLFRSDDRGDTWKAVSGDLTRKIDRNSLPVMGKVWGPDAVAKNESTSFYGNIVALAESPAKEGVIFAGTDDGLIQATENGGGAWRNLESFPGVPDRTYVSRILASAHDAATVYASFDNHKNGDFAPYLLKSADAGRTWTSVKANLPENGPVLALAEDPVNPNLLFVGTEFGLFFTVDGGGKWIQLKGEMPTIAVRDLAIQKRESDLVVATFGRGIFVLDDYTPLRNLRADTLSQEAVLFPAKDALMHIESQPLGGRGKAYLGDSFYTAPNVPFGTTFTYYLKESVKTRKERRQEAEKEAAKKGTALPYPGKEELRAEAEEEPPAVLLMITDESGQVVRRLTGPAKAGMQRVSWDLRYPASYLQSERQFKEEGDDDEEGRHPSGPLIMPGNFTVRMARRLDGAEVPLATQQVFDVTVEGVSSMTSPDRAALVQFQQKVSRLQGAVTGALQASNEIKTRLGLIKKALLETPAADARLRQEAVALETQLNDILRNLRGDTALQARNENVPIPISERVSQIVGDQRMSTSQPTRTHQEQYQIAADDFAVELKRLRNLVQVDLAKLEKAMEAAGAPWTPGRIPEWK
jgi:photosystem II stability/assembly factor-like uncharacterized protein